MYLCKVARQDDHLWTTIFTNKDMKQKIYFIGILFLLNLLSNTMFAYDYPSAWKEVDKTSRRQPQTAINKIKEIEKAAIAEGNRIQQLKSILYRCQTESLKNDDAIQTAIAELKNFRDQESGTALRSIASCYLAKAISGYHLQNQSERTDLEGIIPENMEEWTNNIFQDTIVKLCKEALAPAHQLIQINATDFAPLINQGKDSRRLRPTLYDLLCHETLSIDEYDGHKTETLESLVKLHEADKDKSAFIYASIALINEKQGQNIYVPSRPMTKFGQQTGAGNSPEDDKFRQKTTALEELLSQHKTEEASLLIIEEIANTYLENYAEVENAATPYHVNKICKEGISLFPKSIYVKNINSILEKINAPSLSISIKEKNHSGEKIKISINYANIENFDLKIFRRTQSEEEIMKNGRNDNLCKPTKTINLKLKKSDFYIKKDTVIEIAPLEYGHYFAKYPSDKNQSIDFHVSDLAAISCLSSQDGGKRYFVVDTKTGAPIENATASFYRQKQRTHIEETDKDGFLKYISNKESTVLFAIGQDSHSAPQNCWSWTERREHKNQPYTAIFTDRSIYRPGQTVHFKAIIGDLSETGDNQVIAGKKATAKIHDANFNMIEEKKLTTNEFGSIQGLFVLPTNSMSGSYFIEVLDGRQNIRVEEYKRPTFEIEMEKPSGSYTFGDSITIQGAAQYLTGTPVSTAKATYTITRKPFWSWFGIYQQEEIAWQNTLQTNNDGEFQISFVPQKEEGLDMDLYLYTIVTEITDSNGETQTQETYIAVGDRSMYLSFPGKERTLTDSLSQLPLSVVNLDGEGLEKEISYYILDEKRKTKREGKISSDKKGIAFLPASVSNLTSGKYKIVFKTVDNQNREVCDTFATVLYRNTDKRPPVETALWIEDPGQKEYKWGDKIKFRFGSSFADAHLLYIIEDEFGIIEKHWTKINNEIKDLSLTVSPKNGDAIKFQFILIKDGQYHSHNFEAKRTSEMKDLPLKLSVFRDKTLPGSKETWTLNTTSRKEAEVLVSMHDAALDQIAPLAWDFKPIYNKYIRLSNWENSDIDRNHTRTFLYETRHYKTTLSFDHLMGINLNKYSGRTFTFRNAMSATEMKMDIEENVTYETLGIKEEATDKSIQSVETEEKPAIRTNFAETAFFYPQLLTDSVGNVTFSFQMPESLTKWNFLALAHTKDFYYGQTSQSIITKKEFMVSPNLPRFVRQGDRCTFSAKITNLSNSDMHGTATIEIDNAEDNKSIIKKETEFSVSADSSVTVFWEVDVPTDKELIVVRTWGKSNKFSDGEQSLLPVLTDRAVVTQSLPIFVRKEGVSTFSFNQLKENESKTLQNKSLKLEFTSNPVWYALQALPSIAVPENNCAHSLVAAYYAASLSEHIANSNPKISSIIKIWKQQGADKNTLLSNLEKNEDVKNILLNETPWVTEAKDESDQKRQLSLLLDINEQSGKRTDILNKLNKLRNSDGSYSWFAEMNGSRHLTLLVLENFGRLRKMGVANYTESEWEGIRMSIAYIDNCIKKDFEDLKKSHPTNYDPYTHVDISDLYYFYVRTLFRDIEPKKDVQTAYSFYLSKIKKQWEKQSLYGKAMAAIILQQNGDSKVARQIIQSLREYATTSDDNGMYWKRNKNGYFWQESAIATQTAILEAFNETGCPNSELDDMRTWLLQQKRTQQWGSTIATINAVYALLLKGTDWVTNKNETTIQIGTDTISTKQAEAGTGYITRFFDPAKISAEMATVTIDKQGEGPAWGAVYWQFSEKMDKIEDSKCDLQIEKSIMKEQISGKSKVLTPITEKTKLKVGDKIMVRITIRALRDLEYVALKDQRAACLEPEKQTSRYQHREGIGYYQSPKDASMQYFFDFLPKGTYVFEYPLYVSHSGEYTNGIATLQCLYAPEFVANTESIKLKVGK